MAGRAGGRRATRRRLAARRAAGATIGRERWGGARPANRNRKGAAAWAREAAVRQWDRTGRRCLVYLLRLRSMVWTSVFLVLAHRSSVQGTRDTPWKLKTGHNLLNF
eukprot:7207981-Prymnesium_polylepis.1